MLPPSIPTSFVPHSASVAQRRFSSGTSSMLNFAMYFISIAVFVLAVGIFFYGKVLETTKADKDAELAQAEAAINPTTAENFVRLSNRLSAGQTLLSNHIAFSEFFSSLGILLPSNVRFSTLHLSLDDKGVAHFEGSGVAKSFNALAAVSASFARDGRIKNAIFSNIVVSPRDSSVSFSLSSTLDQKVVSFSP